MITESLCWSEVLYHIITGVSFWLIIMFWSENKELMTTELTDSIDEVHVCRLIL